MKFILGYIKGSRSPVNPARPVLHMAIRADYEGRTFIFERLKRDAAGLVLPELLVHDSDGVPDAVIQTLLVTEQIIECDENGNTAMSALKATGM